MAVADAGDARTEEFLESICAGHKVEPWDWMPDEYRALNVKVIEMNANSELTGALLDGEWISRAPTLWRKRTLAAKVQDEIGHAHLIYRVAETLGRPRRQMYDDLVQGRGKCHNVVHYPTYSWGDVAAIGFLVDGAAIVTQKAFGDTSYGPYARVMHRVNAEESLHYRHGEDLLLAMASGTDEQFEMLQAAFDRWWAPSIAFFGTRLPADQDPLVYWGIKPRANEDLRQEFLSRYVPKLWDVGLEIPDPGLGYEAQSQFWTYTEPDWDELRRMAKLGVSAGASDRLARFQANARKHAWIREVVTGDLSRAA